MRGGGWVRRENRCGEREMEEDGDSGRGCRPRCLFVVKSEEETAGGGDVEGKRKKGSNGQAAGESASARPLITAWAGDESLVVLESGPWPHSASAWRAHTPPRPSSPLLCVQPKDEHSYLPIGSGRALRFRTELRQSYPHAPPKPPRLMAPHTYDDRLGVVVVQARGYSASTVRTGKPSPEVGGRVHGCWAARWPGLGCLAWSVACHCQSLPRRLW